MPYKLLINVLDKIYAWPYYIYLINMFLQTEMSHSLSSYKILHSMLGALFLLFLRHPMFSSASYSTFSHIHWYPTSCVTPQKCKFDNKHQLKISFGHVLISGVPKVCRKSHSHVSFHLEHSHHTSCTSLNFVCSFTPPFQTPQDAL